ncbi:alkene reductase [Aquabacterium sp. J223]|uniref:alkene reductase n=1 Tax=Aquabacterium sp. J223 TaxID=2898431 RepID=UPI0021ADE241|nr:alkene reductase [Aquabacterium sp. J223]UUX96111.1 alkene reductase [Aquabacterium sp. J223]
MSRLFEPVTVGDVPLSNRIVMAPLTRNRAPNQVPSDLAVTYYRQRASAGLIVTEATPISPLGHGYLDTPGLHRDDQVAAWRRITDAVHAAGGRIAVQLWHVGRISHVSLLPEGEVPVSSTARAAQAKTFTRNGFEDVSAPRALRREEIAGIVEDYARAARRATDAGFDFVEVHAANGYLIEQFLRDSINDRDDDYGGSINNRTRLLHEVMRAVAGEIGGARTGVRLAPLKLAFVHVVEGSTGGPRDVAPFDYAALKRRFAGAWIVNNGYDRAMALQAVDSGAADLVAFGRPFIANPDLVRRLKEDLPLATPERRTMYGGGAAGYTDYPAWEAGAVRA